MHRYIAILILFFCFDFAFADLVPAYEKEDYYVTSGLKQKTNESSREHFARLQEAYRSGNHHAAFGIAFYYRNGVLLKKDFSNAISFYKKSCELGIFNGYYQIGFTYHFSILPRDITNAIYWYKLAAGEGISKAARQLGDIYGEGIDVEVDYEEADKWYQEYARLEGRAGILDAAKIYVMRYENTPLFEKGMATLQYYLAENDADAQCKYAEYLFKCKKDKANAKLYWEKSAAQGWATAYYWLGISEYLNENKHFTKRSVDYLRKGAELGDTESQAIVGGFYYLGEAGLRRNREAALKWLGKAAEKRHALACHFLGVMYREGNLVKKDAKRAADYFMTSAEGKYPVAQLALARMYIFGEGVPKNMDLAKELLESSAAGGNEAAQKVLDVFEMYGK